jgi:hypothetical protein
MRGRERTAFQESYMSDFPLGDLNLSRGVQTIQQRLQLCEVGYHVLRARGHHAVRICTGWTTNRQ